MGPFHNRIRNIIRKKLFNYADKIVIRENISNPIWMNYYRIIRRLLH